MVEPPSSYQAAQTRSSSEYLEPGESIVIVDDSPEIILIFESLLTTEGFTVFTAKNATELYQILEKENIALILLDIELPDRDGTEILADIVPRFPDLGIVMLTGSLDLNIALNCLRQGADDYLTKPVTLEEFSLAVRKTLQKRKLTIDNRKYQRQLELTNYRTRFLHQLNLKMNSAYLSTIELNSVLQSILVGITAEEGLKFNRAFLLLFNEEHTELQGKMAIGPSCRAEAGRVWDEIKQKNMHLSDILDEVRNCCLDGDREINKIVQILKIPVSDHSHILIQACTKRTSILVEEGKAEGIPVSSELIGILGENTFIATPLFSPKKSLGVLIADNFVTRHPITEDDINSLEIFASQASLAIEHSHLYQDMLSKIIELEQVTQELEKNKDLLVKAERYSALGHMSAQLVHAIRNPITSIGGIARLLAKKTTEEKDLKFLDMLILESGKIESTLEDLFNFVGEAKPEKYLRPLYPLIRKSIMLFYGTMKKQSITYQLNLPAPDPLIFMDSKMIRQMLHHLIRNAIEAMPSGGLLGISCEEGEVNVTITITDTGSGIANANMTRIADPFFTTKTYGTGMGLTLVEKIIAEHQGRFFLSHSDEGGMVAKISLPKTERENVDPQQ
ncbi:MAG: response regulator [Proteobacteria bacterium]|nr:response regulator [Pseudomonadota bacterium]MBU1455039.1 response regulator [Pseudomonadota bacterium]